MFIQKEIKFAVKSQTGDITYVVTYGNNLYSKELSEHKKVMDFSCTCPDWGFNRRKHGGYCKHIQEVLNGGFTPESLYKSETAFYAVPHNVMEKICKEHGINIHDFPLVSGDFVEMRVDYMSNVKAKIEAMRQNGIIGSDKSGNENNQGVNDGGDSNKGVVADSLHGKDKRDLSAQIEGAQKKSLFLSGKPLTKK